ncbi:MAG: hypothetical protein E6I60_16755 [Chloroflexi bacterium]|nr:MAG: hypothetical protein E6I60_16755 [Chloroflexota bacterium]
MPALALVMLAITVVPAEVWRAPGNDEIYDGFDPNLVYASPGGSGHVRVARDVIDVTAPSSSRPSVNLATTLRQTLSTSRFESASGPPGPEAGTSWPSALAPGGRSARSRSPVASRD